MNKISFLRSLGDPKHKIKFTDAFLVPKRFLHPIYSDF
jgi:hypothetical protein